MRLNRKKVGAVGRIEQYAATIPPKNTIKANGAELNRSLFWRLWKHAQESGNLSDQASKEKGQFGSGDGVNTFTLPDYRGYFLRGLDDGHGVDAGRGLGTLQDSDNKSHSHGMAEAGNHRHSYSNNVNSTAGYGDKTRASTARKTEYTSYSGDHTHTIDASGGAESRPKNVSVMFCIRYQ